MQLHVINSPAHPVILHCSVLQRGPENAPPALGCTLRAAFVNKLKSLSRGLLNVLRYGLLATGECRLNLFCI